MMNSSGTDYNVVINPPGKKIELPKISQLEPGTIFEGPREGEHIYMRLNASTCRSSPSVDQERHSPCLYVGSGDGHVSWWPNDERPKRIFKRAKVELFT